MKPSAFTLEVGGFCYRPEFGIEKLTRKGFQHFEFMLFFCDNATDSKDSLSPLAIAAQHQGADAADLASGCRGGPEARRGAY